jgi:uncharacterized membrane protein
MYPMRLIRAFLHRPRLLVSAGVGMLVVLGLPVFMESRDITRWLIGWNVGAWTYLCLAGLMMTEPGQQAIQRRALVQDEGALTILALVAVAALASLGSIVAELSVAKDLHGVIKLAHIGLAVLTIVSSWAFTQVMFALHYAHDYYQSRREGEPGGLSFPDTDQPAYLDFLYVAAVIGTSGQTADVAFSSSAMRRVGMAHCVLAFFFNTTLLALTINVGSSLL